MIQLPSEVLCGGILPHLSVCDLQALDTAFTNKYHRPQLQQVWKSYQYNSCNVVLSEPQISWLCEIGVHIISVVLLNVNLELRIRNILTLKNLRLLSEIHSSSLLKIASNIPCCEELTLRNVCGPDADNAISALAQNCRQLRTLLIDSKELTDAGILALSQCCGQLSKISICHVQITDAGIQALCDNCPHLKHIELVSCINLTDASLIAIANTYPCLEVLFLYHDIFSDDAAIFVADKCHELRSVSVKCDNITSRGLTALWAANPKLMDVDISFNPFISDNDVIIQLVQCCPLLQKLNISHCNVTDAAVIAVAEHCPQLRSLDISYCYDLSDASLIALGEHCHELKSIDISFLLRIRDVGIAALAAGCPLLQAFYVSKTSITDAGVVALARGCRDLRKVSIGRRSIVTSVSAIAENCPLISELNLSECKVDDACLYVIAQHCRNLTMLRMENTKVSIDAFRALITSCRMLEKIYCSYSDKMILRKCSPRAKNLI